MVFSTPIFLFYFLVLTMLVYYLVPRKLRNLVILCASLFFYYWGEQQYVAIMFLSTAIDFTHGLLVEHCKNKGNDKGARMAVASSIVFNLALLFFFKYWDFIAGSLQSMGLTFMPVLGIHLPIGISFYTFQTMSYTIDVYRGDTRAQRSSAAASTSAPSSPFSPSSLPVPLSSIRTWATRSTSAPAAWTSSPPVCRASWWAWARSCSSPTT